MRKIISSVNLRCPKPFFFCPVYKPLNLPRRKLLVICTQTLQNALDDGQLIPGVQNLESLWQSRVPVMGSQQSVAEPMKSAYPHAGGTDRQHGGNPREHF